MCSGTGRLFKLGHAGKFVAGDAGILRNRPMYTEEYTCELCNGFREVSSEKLFEWKLRNETKKT